MASYPSQPGFKTPTSSPLPSIVHVTRMDAVLCSQYSTHPMERVNQKYLASVRRLLNENPVTVFVRVSVFRDRQKQTEAETPRKPIRMASTDR